MSEREAVAAYLADLRAAFQEVVEAPASIETARGEDGEAAEESVSPRAAAANALSALAMQARDAYWDGADAQGEAACLLLSEISMYVVDPVLRETMLELAGGCLAALTGAHSAGQGTHPWTPGTIESLQARFDAAKPADDDATAIARALGLSDEEAVAFGLTGNIVTVGLDEDEAAHDEWAPGDEGVYPAAQAVPVEIESLVVLFRRDAHDLVATAMPRVLQRYWRNQSSMDDLLAVRRAFHTLKGDAAVAAQNCDDAAEVEELRGLSRISEAAEDIIDELLGDEREAVDPAPALPPGAFGLLHEVQAYVLKRLEARAALPNEDELLQRLEAMQAKHACSRTLAGGEGHVGYVGQQADHEPATSAPPATVLAAPAIAPIAPIAPIAAGRKRDMGANARLLATFLSEAAKLMPDLHRALARLSDEPSDENALVRARVKLHTLKGGATLAGPDVVEIERLAHSGEDILELIEDFQLAGSLTTVPAEVLNCVLDVEDALQWQLDGLRPRVDDPSGATSRVTSPTMLPKPDTDALIERVAGVKERVERGDLVGAVGAATATPDALSASGAAATPLSAAAIAPPQETETAAAYGAGQPLLAGLLPLPALPSDRPDTTALQPVAAPHVTAVSVSVSDELSGLAAVQGYVPSPAREDSVQAAVRALEDQQVNRDALDLLLHAMSAQAVESQRANARLRDLATRVEQELAGLRQELVKTTRRTGDWDALEKEEYTSIDVLLMQLDEALADQRDAETLLRRDLAEARAQTESQSDALMRAQRALLHASMVPLSSLEARLDHAVRSVGRRLKKSVTFEMDGGDVTLDRRITESLANPLMLLINNAVDHGLEQAPAERAALGKTPEGRIVVRGRTDGDSVTIELCDDGRGIDTDRLAAVAVSKGLVDAHRAAAMTPDERMTLIWEPGFSTAGQVSAISGRGMGMKSVRDDITALQGRIDVSASVGTGTTFTITLPRSMAMLRVQVIRESDHVVAVPITALAATHAVSFDSVVEIPGGRAVRVGPRTLSVYSAHLSAGPAGDGDDDAAPHTRERQGILLEIAGRDGGILVDDVLSSQYLPVRPAATYLQRSCGLIGYALGAGGVIMPIIDIETVLAKASPALPLISLDTGTGTGAGIGASSAHAAGRQHTILVVDDSQTVRRALSQTFARTGFNVREASNGREALTSISRDMPDIITLDMEMPGMDGLETLAALRLLPGGGDVPVFMITSRQQARHRAAAIAAGVTRYFTKPYDSDELVGAARLALAATRASADAAS